MPVGRMLKEMTQRELCHWIAFFKLENEEHAQARKQMDKTDVTQAQKDGAMLTQLFAMAARGRSGQAVTQ